MSAKPESGMTRSPVSVETLQSIFLADAFGLV